MSSQRGHAQPRQPSMAPQGAWTRGQPRAPPASAAAPSAPVGGHVNMSSQGGHVQPRQPAPSVDPQGAWPRGQPLAPASAAAPSAPVGGVAQPHSEMLAQRVRQDKIHYQVSAKFNKESSDQSFYLVHFTKSSNPVMHKDQSGPPAHLRFEMIMDGGEVAAFDVPHVKPHQVEAVCFTEMAAGSLSRHADSYSAWGFAFHKSFLYNVNKANPVLYCRPGIMEAIVGNSNGNPNVLRYLTPLKPLYDEAATYNHDNKPVDYAHEREWRTPGPSPFHWANLAWISCPSIALFKNLLPNLYDRVVAAGVTIKPIDPLLTENMCFDGFGCQRGLNCPHDHCREEKAFFSWRSNETATVTATAAPARVFNSDVCRYGRGCINFYCTRNHPDSRDKPPCGDGRNCNKGMTCSSFTHPRH